MSDNYGPEQKKVLSTEDRNWDSSVHLNHRPVLTSELNVHGQIASEKSRASNLVHMPSGFLRKGSILFSDDLDALKSTSVSGEVLTSSELTNSFFISSDGETNLAMVNGWPLNISATGTPTGENHNLIMMGDYSSTFTEFVFLEVWREMVSYQDTVKKYGNQTAYAQVANDLYSEGIGFETSQRVQIKYRVRVEKGFTIDLSTNPDGFNTSVYARGGSSSNSSKNFTNMGSLGDPGLYRAGNGSSSDQSTLGTVDGFVYAIPMFLVSRRVRPTNPISGFDPTDPQAMYNAGKKSDGSPFRPDNLYADVIYPQDIVDLRRQVNVGTTNPRSASEKTLRSIAKGSYLGTKGKLSLASGGFSDAPGGTSLIAVDKLSSDSLVSTMGLVKDSVPRRSFCNSSCDQINNVRKIEVSDWSSGEFSLSLEGYLDNAGCSVSFINLSSHFIYSVSGWKEEGVDYVYSLNPHVIPGSTNYIYSLDISVIGATPTEDWFLKYDIRIDPNGTHGFTNIPSKSLEQRVGSVINAEYGNPVNLNKRDSFYTSGDQIKLLGLGDQDVSHIGQVAFIESNVESPNSIYLDLPGMVMPYTGQEVLGVRSVRRKDSSGNLGEYKAINFTRLDQNLLTIGVAAALPGETDVVEVSLYLGTKTFGTDNCGKGITDTLESTFLSVSRVSGTKYKFTSDAKSVGSDMKAIKGMCSFLVGPVDRPTYTPYFLRKPSGFTYFESVPSTALRSSRASIPLYETPSFPDPENNSTTVTWEQGGTPYIGEELKIGAFLYSWPDPNDDLIQIVYNTRGYQGMLLDVSKQVDILCEGPALISASGSGSSATTLFPVNKATVGSDRTVKIYESDEGRLLDKGQILEGDFFRLGTDEIVEYRVSGVSTSTDGNGAYTEVTLYDNLIPSESLGVVYSLLFVRKNTSPDTFTNVVGRMPSASNDDYLYNRSYLQYGTSTLVRNPVSMSSDALASGTNGVILGPGSTSLRGVQDMTVIPVDGQEYQENTKVRTVYGEVLSGSDYKIFQSYVAKEKATGKTYLAVMSSDSSSGSYIPSTDSFQGKDVVDIFELEGRTVFKAAT